ncbi:hypothetical protein ACFO4L_07065 [Bacillus daqingensis]|uniref:Uncharacterized protein n=2 Tax=Bacillaceae TaxID=186817 RepID=A0A969PTF4_9BACI|nr:hypothetical protein [Alkalicoccus luteus]NJP38056.1 hypothetical protein [Alkalicoccus luteus]
MTFFIDHKQKRVHRVLCAGDKCGFNETPADQREFTNSSEQIDRLVRDMAYHKCSHCEAFTLVGK